MYFRVDTNPVYFFLAPKTYISYISAINYITEIGEIFALKLFGLNLMLSMTAVF